MKQIVFLFFTLSGIYTASAQNDAAVSIAPDSQYAAQPALAVGKTSSSEKDSSSFKRPATVQIVTNPVKNKLQLAANNFTPGTIQVLISDTRAHILRNDARMVYSTSELITVMFSLPAGMYIVTLKQKGKTVSKKFVVVP